MDYQRTVRCYIWSHPGYEKNFMQTGWFVYFRVYAPLQPFFDKTFNLPDFGMVE